MMKFWKISGFILGLGGTLELFGVLKQHPENLHCLIALATATIMLCICDAVKAVQSA